MKKKLFGHSLLLSIIAVLAAVSVLSAATYAWFTYTNYTNITPIAGTVSKGDGSLLISARPDGGFGLTCTLPFESTAESLYPVSTADLSSFYSPVTQSNGIVMSYKETDVNTRAMHGRIYLKADGVGFDVFLWPASLSFGTDIQALASMRLGLRIATAAGTVSYIFRLDEFGDVSLAEAQQTTSQQDVVVSDIGAGGSPVYVSDPSQLTASYRAGGSADAVTPGARILCSLSADEVASVEYWLWLEGCDENCINAVQSRDVSMQLGFAGVQN